jgi:hypothetical protein
VTSERRAIPESGIVRPHGDPMSGYFGTAAQRRLQAQAEASVGFIDATPGACHTGRMMGCDDLVRLGWAQIDAFLERDGACGFRMIPVDRVNELRSDASSAFARSPTKTSHVSNRPCSASSTQRISTSSCPRRPCLLGGWSNPADYVSTRHSCVASRRRTIQRASLDRRDLVRSLTASGPFSRR